MRVRKFYVVEFRKKGRQPRTRIMDVIPYNWFVPSGDRKNVVLRCVFPEDPSNPVVADDVVRRQRTRADPDPTWDSYRVKIRGRSNDLNDAYKKLQSCQSELSALTCDEEFMKLDEVELNEARIILQEYLKRQAKGMTDEVRDEGHDPEEASTEASSSVAPPNKPKKSLKKKQAKRTSVQLPASEPKRKRTEKSLLEVEKDHVVNEEFVQGYDSPESPTIENQGAINMPDTNAENEAIDLLGKDPASIEALIKDGFRITFDLMLAMKSQLSIRLDRLDKRMDRLESLIPKRTEELSILGADDLAAKYNLTLPMDNYAQFENFDGKLLSDKAFRHDVKSLLQLSLHPGRMSKSAVVMLKAFMTRNLGIIFVGANPKEGQHSLFITNFFGLMKEIILNKKIKNVDEQRKLRADVCSVLSNASKWAKQFGKENVLETEGDDKQAEEAQDPPSEGEEDLNTDYHRSK